MSTETPMLDEMPGEEEVEWVCKGWRLDSKGVLVQSWKIREEEHWFTRSRAPVRIAGAGTVYRFTMKGSSYFTAGPRRPVYVRTLDGPEVHEWVALSQAALITKAASNSAKKALEKDSIRKQLDPIKRVADKLNTTERRALVATVIDVLYS